jgi:hypothetical protein
METHTFDEHTRTVLESSAAPIGVYQVMDGQAITLLVSNGLCKLLGNKRRAEAIETMTHSMSVNATEVMRAKEESARTEAAYQEALSTRAIYESIVDAL